MQTTPLPPPSPSPSPPPSSLQQLSQGQDVELTVAGQPDRHSYTHGGGRGPTKKQIWIYRARLMAGLFLPFSLSALDTTIVATALPHIASRFDQLSQQTWIVTAFTLTNTAFIPAFGQLSNVFGRHAVLQGALAMMWVGSALCTGATRFEVLLLGRAIVGISCAGLDVMTGVILSDKVSLREVALQRTLFGIIAGISFGIGPVIGGALADVNWRWCFGISIPIAFLAHILIFLILRSELLPGQPLTRHDPVTGALLHSRPRTLSEKFTSVDYPGMVLCILATMLLTMSLLWGGSSYPWASAAVLVPLVSSILIFAAFVVFEHFISPRPLIPTSLFTNTKDFSFLAYISFSAGAALYAMFYFISIYFSLVAGYDASKAGRQLLYYIPGLGAGTYFSMYACNRRPRETFPPLAIGSIALVVALGLLSSAINRGNQGLIVGMSVLTGFGGGALYMPNGLHAIAQLRDKQKELASATAVIMFFEPLGGTVATALMGSVFNNKVAARVGGEVLSSLRELVEGKAGEAVVGEELREAARQGIRWAFVAITPVVGVAAVCTLCLGAVVIDGKMGVPEEKEGKKEGVDERWAAVRWTKILILWWFRGSWL